MGEGLTAGEKSSGGGGVMFIFQRTCFSATATDNVHIKFRTGNPFLDLACIYPRSDLRGRSRNPQCL